MLNIHKTHTSKFYLRKNRFFVIQKNDVIILIRNTRTINIETKINLNEKFVEEIVFCKL